MESSIKPNLLKLASAAKNLNLQVYAVGGSIRDHFLKRPCSDFDFTCSNANLLANHFSAQNRHKLIPLDETPGRETCRIIINNSIHFDFSQMHGESIEEDLSRRDFTINALAQTLYDFIEKNSNFIDPFQGQRDIKSQTVKMVSENALREDPLRLLRAFRFANTLEFSIDTKTRQVIASMANLINQVSGERIHSELNWLFQAAHIQIQELWDSKLLQELFPEINNSPKVTFDVLNEIESMLSNTMDAVTQMPLQHSTPTPDSRFILRMAGLLHSLEQPQTNTSAPKSFRKNNPFPKRLKVLKFSTDEIKQIDRSLYFTTRILEQINKPNSSELTCGSKYRLVKDFEGEEWIALPLANCIQVATGGPDIGSTIQDIYHFYHEQYLPAKNKPPIFDGHRLSSRLNLKPSSKFKMILEQIEEARILGKITNAEEAEQLARELIDINRDTE